VRKDNLYLGRKGEDAAAGFLKRNGYKIIARNFRNKLGEVDIIAYDGHTVCFIEVKTRSSEKFGIPIEAVSSLKQRQISRVALSFLKDNNILNKEARFDVVSVLFVKEGAKIELIRNAFDMTGEITY